MSSKPVSPFPPAQLPPEVHQERQCDECHRVLPLTAFSRSRCGGQNVPGAVCLQCTGGYDAGKVKREQQEKERAIQEFCERVRNGATTAWPAIEKLIQLL